MSAHDDGHCQVSSVMTTSGDKTILQSMYLDFPTNAITGILGPSGSGKTTLLSVITDSIQTNVKACGELHLPGESAFVPQDDRLHGFYTCKKYMHHYARLSGLPNDESTNERIDMLLAKLGLTSQADTIVGDIFLKGLSGGQKRRLSIALEALSEPSTFILDECTSGLDAESALQVMEFLKDYARLAPGRRVILTIHQPSSFIWTLLDHVILLSRGQLMFQGPREDIEVFFSSAGYPTKPGWNPSEHYITAVNDEFRDHELSVEEWHAKYVEWAQLHPISKAPQPNSIKRRNNSIVKASNLEMRKTQRSGGPTVVVELTYRYFLNLWFNPGILGTRVAMYSMLALMVGALFWNLGERDDLLAIQSRAAVLFYCVAFFVFMSVAVLPFTVMERGIVDKEVMNKYYHPIMYQISQGLASIPGTALLAFLTTILVVPMTGLNEGFWYFLNMYLSLLVAEALAQLVSHVVPHFVIGMAVIAGLYGFFMLFQGFMLVPSDFPDWLRWTNKVAFHTYSWRTFMVNEFRGQTFSSVQFPTGEDVLRAYEIEDVDRGNDMIVLLFYGLILHILSCAVLQVKYFYLKVALQPLEDTTDDISRTNPEIPLNGSFTAKTEVRANSKVVETPSMTEVVTTEIDC